MILLYTNVEELNNVFLPYLPFIKERLIVIECNTRHLMNIGTEMIFIQSALGWLDS